MSRAWTMLLNRLRARRDRLRLNHALALHMRGEVRPDGLRVKRICNRLEIQWWARDIHPWDRDLPPERKARLFREQSLADTEAVISRLFKTLPEVDVIDLEVLDPASGMAMIAGAVERATWTGRQRPISVGMRLQELGVRWQMAS